MGLLANRIRTGAIQTNPLKVGRYWIDLFGSKEYRACLAEGFETAKTLGPAYYYSWKAKCYVTPGGADEGIGAFNDWGEANSSSVKVLRIEEFDDGGAPGFGSSEKLTAPRKWVLFELVNPVVWPTELAKVIGIPTPADDDIKTSDDTVQKPPPEKGVLESGGLLDEAKPWIIGGGVLIGLALVVSLVRR